MRQEWSRPAGRVGSIIATGILLLLAACGSSGGGTQGGGSTTKTLRTLSVTPAAVSVAAGLGQQLTATGVYSDGSQQDLTSSVGWSSSDTTVTTVSASGLATSLAPGSSTVSATLSGISGSATITVTAATLVSIALAPGSADITYANTQPFTASGTYTDHTTHDITAMVVWSSSNAGVATIGNVAGNAGVVVPQSVGSTQIGATLSGVAAPAVTMQVHAPTEAVLYSFAGGADGNAPNGPLIQASDGNFYGTTITGGSSNNGTVFKVTPAGVETVLYAFAGGNDGASPSGPLTQGSDGNFYGTTVAGGSSNSGTVFKITPAGVETVLYSFTGLVAGSTDGIHPSGTLIQARDGNFYGTTCCGGLAQAGTVFRITPTGAESILYHFTGSSTGNGDGFLPYNGVLQGSDGNFYGTTSGGGVVGSTGNGTVYRLTPAGVESTLYAFPVLSSGTGPLGGLIQDGAGNLLGVAETGGSNQLGMAYQVSPSGAGTVLYSFSNGADGGFPYGSLILARDGNYYGSTLGGGASTAGVVFRMTPAGGQTTLYAFTGGVPGSGSTDGWYPSTLVQGSDGNLYGVTAGGGINKYGTVFVLR